MSLLPEPRQLVFPMLCSYPALASPKITLLLFVVFLHWHHQQAVDNYYYTLN